MGYKYLKFILYFFLTSFLKKGFSMATLQISGMGFPPYSTNNCTQTLEMIPQGEFVRTLEGDLVFVGTTQNHKYKTLIQGEDVNAPTLSMLSCGRQVLVHCIQPLWQEIAEPQAVLHRPPSVSEPIAAITQQGDSVQVIEETPQHVRIIDDDAPFPIFLVYYPILSMLVRSFTIEGSTEEQPTNWRLELEEI
jgi:hypothetical protein